jgi:hypothetical protein
MSRSRSNSSIERTLSGRLRLPPRSAHVSWALGRGGKRASGTVDAAAGPEGTGRSNHERELHQNRDSAYTIDGAN